jgi:hypothetical protein
MFGRRQAKLSRPFINKGFPLTEAMPLHQGHKGNKTRPVAGVGPHLSSPWGFTGSEPVP